MTRPVIATDAPAIPKERAAEQVDHMVRMGWITYAEGRAMKAQRQARARQVKAWAAQDAQIAHAQATAYERTLAVDAPRNADERSFLARHGYVKC